MRIRRLAILILIAVCTLLSAGPAPSEPLECFEGYVALDGWWAEFCGDGAENFASGPDYGIMRSNAEALRLMANGERLPEGFLEIEIYFATDQVPQGTGGLHILSPTSAHKAIHSPVGKKLYKGWLRPDLELHPVDGVRAELKVGTYNCDGNGAYWFERARGRPDVVVDVWRTGIIVDPQKWIPIRLEWRRTGPDRLQLTLNGKTTEVRIHPDSEDILAFAVGNMDGLDDFGGTPEVRYRAARWGKL
jgi:hypothetical protein